MIIYIICILLESFLRRYKMKLSHIKELQTSEEYIEFSLWLQGLTSFPSVRRDNDGYFIVHKVGKHQRKLRLGVFFPKEKDDLNLAVFQFQSSDGTLVRPNPPDPRYVVVDNECCLIGVLSFMSSQAVLGYSLYRFYANVFTLDVAIAKKILKDPNFVANVIYTAISPTTGSGSGLGLAVVTGPSVGANVAGLTSYFNGQVPIVGDDNNGIILTLKCGNVQEVRPNVLSFEA